MRNVNRGLLLLTLVALALAGCSNQESRVGGMLNLKTDLTLTVEAAQSINPDVQSSPSPVFLRVYELNSREAFAQADFIELYERDKSALGDTLVQRRQLPRILPGETRAHKLVLDSNTRYVGVLAEFFQYEDSVYKIVVPVTARNVFRDTLEVRISDNQLSVVH
jgi:type VI secretion system protein VasD